MSAPAAPCRLDLRDGQLVRLDREGAVEVRCESGRVWITEEADGRDWWLEGGDRALLEGRGLTLVEATRAARIAITQLRTLA